MNGINGEPCQVTIWKKKKKKRHSHRTELEVPKAEVWTYKHRRHTLTFLKPCTELLESNLHLIWLIRENADQFMWNKSNHLELKLWILYITLYIFIHPINCEGHTICQMPRCLGKIMRQIFPGTCLHEIYNLKLYYIWLSFKRDNKNT